MEIFCVAGQKRPHRRASGQNEGVENARSVRRLAEHSWSEEDLGAVVETPQKPKSTTVDIPSAAESLALPLEAPEVPEDEKEEPKAIPEEDAGMQGETSGTEMTPGVPSSSRGKKRTELQQNVFAKKRVMMISLKGPAIPITPSDNPVLIKKTDTKGDDDVLMPVEIAASDLLHTVHALLNDETGEEAKPWSDESEKTKILTVLDDHKEMMEGRLNSLKELGAMTAVKRSEAVGSIERKMVT